MKTPFKIIFASLLISVSGCVPSLGSFSYFELCDFDPEDADLEEKIEGVYPTIDIIRRYTLVRQNYSLILTVDEDLKYPHMMVSILDSKDDVKLMYDRPNAPQCSSFRKNANLIKKYSLSQDSKVFVWGSNFKMCEATLEKVKQTSDELDQYMPFLIVNQNSGEIYKENICLRRFTSGFYFTLDAI